MGLQTELLPPAAPKHAATLVCVVEPHHLPCPSRAASSHLQLELGVERLAAAVLVADLPQDPRLILWLERICRLHMQAGIHNLRRQPTGIEKGRPRMLPFLCTAPAFRIKPVVSSPRCTCRSCGLRSMCRPSGPWMSRADALHEHTGEPLGQGSSCATSADAASTRCNSRSLQALRPPSRTHARTTHTH